jgi:hypothetical protein
MLLNCLSALQVCAFFWYSDSVASQAIFSSPIILLRLRKKVCVHTSTPRLSRGLVTSLLAHGIWLTLVLRNSGVDGLDDIRSDRSSEDLYSKPVSSIPLHLPPRPQYSSTRKSRKPYLWERVGGTAGRAIGLQDGDGRTGSHLEGLMAGVFVGGCRIWR